MNFLCVLAHKGIKLNFTLHQLHLRLPIKQEYDLKETYKKFNEKCIEINAVTNKTFIFFTSLTKVLFFSPSLG